MATFTISGGNAFQVSEPSLLNAADADRRSASTTFQFTYDGEAGDQITVQLTAGTDGRILHPDGTTQSAALSFTGTQQQVNDWLATVYFVAYDQELGNTSRQTTFAIELSAPGAEAVDRSANATITFANDPTTIVDTAPQVGEGEVGRVLGEETFVITDPELAGGYQADAQIVYTVNTAPEHGFLKNGNTVLGVGSVFTHDDVVSGRITYTHTDLGANEHTNDAFDVTVNDGATPINWTPPPPKWTPETRNNNYRYSA